MSKSERTAWSLGEDIKHLRDRIEKLLQGKTRRVDIRTQMALDAMRHLAKAQALILTAIVTSED